MNKNRRKEIEIIKNRITYCMNELDKIKDDEQDYYDNIPENLVNSTRAMDSEDALDVLEECIDMLSDVCSSLEDI